MVVIMVVVVIIVGVIMEVREVEEGRGEETHPLLPIHPSLVLYRSLNTTPPHSIYIQPPLLQAVTQTQMLPMKREMKME